MRKSVIRVAGVAAALSLMVGSTAAIGATSPTAVVATSSAAGQASAWQALAALNGGASTIALCGAAVAAQASAGCVFPQVDSQVISQAVPPPLPGATAGFRVNPLFILLGLLAAGGLAYLLFHNGNGNNNGNSPT